MSKTYKGVEIPEELATIAEIALDAERENIPMFYELLGRETTKLWQPLAEKWIAMVKDK